MLFCALYTQYVIFGGWHVLKSFGCHGVGVFVTYLLPELYVCVCLMGYGQMSCMLDNAFDFPNFFQRALVKILHLF